MRTRFTLRGADARVPSPCRCAARAGTARGAPRRSQAALLNALDAGSAYVNVHTRRNAAGEIRAQLAVPLVMSTS